MTPRMKTFLPIFAVVFCWLAIAPADAAEVRLNGATTCINSVINPYRAAVEKATGHTLKILGNATGKGLVDLAEGRCDASLTSEPLDIAAEAAKVAGDTIELAQYQVHVIKHEAIVFVVHPSNPVSALTLDQIKRIHTGEITNWKEVGGPDLGIIVFTDALTGGTRAMVKRIILRDAPYADSCRVLDSVRLINFNVPELKGSCGALGVSFVDPEKVKVIQTETVMRPLGFITKGEPTEQVRQVIDAYRTAAGEVAH